MPDAVLSFEAAQLPEGTCFATEQERLNAFVAAMRGILPGNYSTVNKGSTAPESNDRDKPWLRTNPDGSPDGTYYFFDGTWKRAHPLSPGAVMIWTGDASGVPTLDGGSAGTATTMSGPFWEIDPGFAARFPVGVGAFASAAVVNVRDTGGEEKHELLTAELPTALGSLKDPYLSIIAEEPAGNFSLNGTNGAIRKAPLNDLLKGGEGTAHNNLPPFIGVYFIRRTARTHYSI
jgi:hypothetical protein